MAANRPNVDPVKYKTCRRYNVPGDAHELTFCCFHRYKLLAADRTRQWLVDTLDRVRKRYALDLWAYVIMPEHVHLLIFPREDDYSISRILTAIKWPVSSKALAYVREHAPQWIERLTDRQPNGRVDMRFWQRGGGYDRNMTEVSTLHHAVRYIHDNPVRRGLVDDPINWTWSGARWYEGYPDVPLAIDDTLPAMSLQDAQRHARP